MNNVEKFLGTNGRDRITQAVRDVEAVTSGEIVPMIVQSSHDYPMASLTGGFILSLLSGLVISVALSGRDLLSLAGPAFGWGSHALFSDSIWFFLPLFLILLPVMTWLTGMIPPLRRLFISRESMAAEVREGATVSFYKNGLYRTKEETGILLYISLFERTVWILADRGINSKVAEGTWDNVVAMITSGIRNGEGAQVVARAIQTMADPLKEHFPRRINDRDELANLIVDNPSSGHE